MGNESSLNNYVCLPTWLRARSFINLHNNNVDTANRYTLKRLYHLNSKLMQLDYLLELIHSALPPETSMKGDRLGLQVQSGRSRISSILTTLEVTDEVITEAQNNGCDCIVTFHPLIFSPIVSLQDSDRVGRLCSKLIRSEIALIAVHTNFDAFPKGTSAILSHELGLKIERVLVPDLKHDKFGIGVVARCRTTMDSNTLLSIVRRVCGSPLRYSGGENKEINTVAIVGGSGTSFIDDAINSGAECFITADVKYHTFHYASGKIMIIDPGHYEMEHFVPQGLASLLQEITSGKSMGNPPKIICSATTTNPVAYFA
ncbi:MAG: Nif3-like dinuclear metal center hexameric protein [Ignavibacteriae bacterium]|nr:Nif3-like dinuclear metal center hexameric protein [Ignavibacteriota bacterium]